MYLVFYLPLYFRYRTEIHFFWPSDINAPIYLMFANFVYGPWTLLLLISQISFNPLKNTFYILLSSCIFKYLHFVLFQFSKLCISERVKYMYLIPFLHCFEIEMYDWSNQPFGIVFIDHQKNKMWICNKIKTMNPIIWVFQKWFWPPLFIQRDGWIFHFFIIFLSIVARFSQSLGL